MERTTISKNQKGFTLNQKGFTLIEIIAVLVILGILAAVAVPKFIDLQSDAENKAIQGALASIKSQALMDYSKDLLDGDATATSWGGASSYALADFSGAYADDGGTVSVSLTSGPLWFDSAPVKYKSGTFTLY